MSDVTFTVGLDPTQFVSGLSSVKNAADIKGKAAAKTLDKIASSQARINREVAKGARMATGNVRGGVGGGRNMGYMAGQLSMQAQDVAIMAQMGANTSRIIAQQGSQILSIFGPGGAIAGGVLAIGAAIVGWAFGTEKANAAAKKLAESHKKAADDVKAMNADIIATEDRIADMVNKRTKSAQEAAIASIDTAEKRRLEALEEERKAAIEIAKLPLEAEPVSKQMVAWRTGRGPDVMQLETDEMFKRRVQAIRDQNARIIEAFQSVERSKSAISMEHEEKRIAVIAEEQEKAYEAHKKAENELQAEKEKNEDEIAMLSAKRHAERQKRFDDEIAMLGKVGAAAIAADDKREADEKKRAEREKEKDNLERIQLAAKGHEELRGRTMGRSGSSIRRQLRDEARAVNAEERWNQKIIATAGGLQNIHRGLGGEIISGIDPMTGERIRGGGAQKRAELGRRAHNIMANGKEVDMSDAAVQKLVKAIAELLPK